MIQNLKKQQGSYTLEALISLSAFLLVIMLAYMQVKALIAEQIMQHAVCDMSQQVASYVYILDRAGLVIQHSDDELSDTNNLITTTTKNFQDMSGLVTKVFSSGDINSGTAKEMSDSFSMFIDGIVTGIQEIDWEKQLTDAGKEIGDDLLKSISNQCMNGLYGHMLESYLPMDLKSFCKVFNIKEGSISFEESRVFPSDANNSIFVAVSYEAYPAFRFANVGEHKVVKCAYTAAWVKSNANK